MFDQTAHRIEGNVVIDELAEVGIECRDAALLGVGTILGGSSNRRSSCRPSNEVVSARGVVFAVPRGGQRTKHPAESSLKQRR